jgi:hypothetical protein
MPERFISEAIQPVAATFDTARMARETGLPQELVGRTFKWRPCCYWRDTGKCRHGSPSCMFAALVQKLPTSRAR